MKKVSSIFFFLIRLSAADTNDKIVHVDLPSNPQAQALSWFTTHPKVEFHTFLLLSDIKGNSTSSQSWPVLPKAPLSM